MSEQIMTPEARAQIMALMGNGALKNAARAVNATDRQRHLDQQLEMQTNGQQQIAPPMQQPSQGGPVQFFTPPQRQTIEQQKKLAEMLRKQKEAAGSLQDNP